MKINVMERLFTAKEKINILGSLEKSTNSLGSAGLGFSKHRPAGKKNAAKYSNVAKVMDAIFVDKRVNGYCSDDLVYGEVKVDTDIIKFTVNSSRVSYEGERLHGSDAMIPIVMYYLKNNNGSDEFYEAFNEVKSNVEEYGFAEAESLLKACDSFYYQHAVKAGEINILEDDLTIETVKRSISTGLIGSMDAFANIEDILPMSISIALKKKKEKKKSIENSFADIKTGSSLIPFDWDENQKLKIPHLSSLESFVPSKTFYSMLNKVKTRLEKVSIRLDGGAEGVDAIGKDYINVFITGKPGTGKTTLAYALGAATGMPTYTVAMTKNTEEDVFQGMTKVVDNSLSFVSTDFLEAYTKGGIIILEEINLPDPAVVMGAIGQAVEFPFILLKNGYEPVRRHPMCVIIGTMNIGTYGSKGVNQALSSRFKQSYILDDPKKEDFLKVLLQINPDPSTVNWVYNAYDKLIQYLKSPAVNAEDICLNLTMRGCIGALENMEEGDDPKTAVRNTLLGKISEIDLELANAAYNDVIRSLPDLY